MTNSDVRILQRELIARGFLPAGEDDGVFGIKTLAAANAFRKEVAADPLNANVVTLDDVRATLNLMFPTPKGLPKMDSTVVDVKSGWLSTKNWASVVAFLSVVLPLFGIHLPVGWSDIAYQFITAASALYIFVNNTWFTTTVTPASAKKL